MAVIAPDQLDNFVTLTLSKFERMKWTDISLNHQDHIALSQMLKKKKVGQKGGKDLSWRVQVSNTGNARVSGLFDTDQVAIQDNMVSASIPWRAQTTNWAYDIGEDEFQSDMETIIRIVKEREHSAMNDMAELMEGQLWTAPTGPSHNHQHGIPFWIVKNATEGFNGGNPSGFSDTAGINASTYTNWKNWTSGYTSITKDDLVRKWRKAAEFTKFKAPDPYASITKEENSYYYYTTYAVVSLLEEILEGQNDNLGNDVASKDGRVVFRSTPVVWVPYLSENGTGADSSDPVYGVNWSVFKPFFKTGWEMKRHKPKVAAHQRNVREIHYDSWCNYVCYDRRRQFVLYKN